MPFVVGVDLVGVRVRFRARAQFGARGGVWGRVRSQVRLGLGFEALGADRSAVERCIATPPRETATPKENLVRVRVRVRVKGGAVRR